LVPLIICEFLRDITSIQELVSSLGFPLGSHNNCGKPLGGWVLGLRFRGIHLTTLHKGEIWAKVMQHWATHGFGGWGLTSPIGLYTALFFPEKGFTFRGYLTL